MKITALLAIAGLLSMTGCMIPFRRASATPPPPGPTLARIPEQPSSVEPPPAPRNLPAPPAISQPNPDLKKETVVEIAIPDAAEPPKPSQRRRPVRRTVAAVQPPQPMPESGEKVGDENLEAPVWRLGAVLAPEQKVKMQQETEAFLAVYRKLVETTGIRKLTQPQSEMMNRIRVFAQQAKEAVDRDPLEAYNLAVRGRTLAMALSAELR